MSLTNQSYELIRKSLLAEETWFHQRLSINRLSRQLGIGRSPVRDAVNRLAAEGVLQPVAKSGIVVRSISYEELEDIVGLREALEPYAVKLACSRINHRQKQELVALCREFGELARRVRDTEFRDRAVNRAMQQADWRFHNAILQASDNQMMHKIIEHYQLLLRKVRYPSLATVDHLAQTLLEHWRICRALCWNDPAAASRWMQRHARRGGRRCCKAGGRRGLNSPNTAVLLLSNKGES